MLKKKKIQTKILLISLISMSVLAMGSKALKTTPKTVYHVYLEGKSIGLIKSKKALEEYIDKQQESLKQKYNVNKVYTSSDIDIKKEITYSNNILSTKQIYEKIKDKTSFTIDGYKIVIKNTGETSTDVKKADNKNKTIYVIDKNIFTKSIDKTVKAFINKEAYNIYKSNK